MGRMGGSGEADILVIGAGPAGLFAALELARHGVRARVVERAPQPHRQKVWLFWHRDDVAKITVPTLVLGTWQQVVLIDFDDRPRERTVIVQVLG